MATKITPAQRIAFINKHKKTMSAKKQAITKYQSQFSKRASDYRKNKTYNDPSNVKFKKVPQMGKVQVKDKQLKNLLHTETKTYQGWQYSFFSTNVKAFKMKKGNLLVQFLDNSIYAYWGAAKLFQNFLIAGSKGKWVWRNLRRKNISYSKIM